MAVPNIYEMGSEYWLDKIPEGASGIPSWLKERGAVSLVSSGRGAICSALKVAAKKGFHRALLPSYLCRAMIAPFESMGFSVDFYSIDNSFKCNVDEIRAQCLKAPSVLFHMGFFGFETNAELKTKLSELRENNTFVIEDVTHTLFSNFLSSNSDFEVASLRKWVGIPSGGAIFSSNHALIGDEHGIHEELVDVRLKALLLKGEYLRSGNVSKKKRYLKLFSQGEDILDEDAKIYSIDPYSVAILKMVDSDTLISRRRSNYNFLSQHLLSTKKVTPAFKGLSENVCPMFFPVFVKKGRDDVKKALIENNLYCTSHWPVYGKLNEGINSKSRYLYDNMISIPCDQRYELEKMTYFAELLTRVLC